MSMEPCTGHPQALPAAARQRTARQGASSVPRKTPHFFARARPSTLAHLLSCSMLWDGSGSVRLLPADGGRGKPPVPEGPGAVLQQEGSGSRGLSMHQAVWFAWGLARMERHTPSARAYVRDCVYSVLELRGAGAGSSSSAGGSAAVGADAQRMDAGQGVNDGGGSRAVRVAAGTAELATLMWVVVRMRMERDPCMLPLVAGLLRSPPLLDLRCARVRRHVIQLCVRMCVVRLCVCLCGVCRLARCLCMYRHLFVCVCARARVCVCVCARVCLCGVY